ncbi:hypothetical protein ACVR1I_03735 [Streptococcus cameli]
MPMKPKKRKELLKETAVSTPEQGKKQLDWATASSVFFILIYAFGVVTNLMSRNYLMALIWTVLIGVNLFFLIRNRRLK